MIASRFSTPKLVDALLAPLELFLARERQALALEFTVVLDVHVAVGRFLPDEILDLLAQAWVVQALLGHIAHGFDEHLLAERKGHRQGIEQLGAVSIAAVPVAPESLGQVDVDFTNRKVGHADSCDCAQSWKDQPA